MDRRVENIVLAHKVATRFAGRPMKPEKMTELLMKLRKGSATSLRGAELDQVFNYLGGWRIDEIQVLIPQGGSYVPKDEPKTYANPHPGNVKTVWERAKANEVKHLPDPEHLKLHEMVYMDVSPITAWERDPTHTSFTFRAWQVSPGVRVTSPDNKTWERAISVDQFLTEYPANNGLMKWLRTETVFLDQINEKLGTESYEAEKARAKAPPRTRANTGTCPCCFRNIKLTPKAKKGSDKTLPGMVVHGYKRPGTGYIHSNCFGEDWPPFELSKDGTIAWVEKLEVSLASHTDSLHSLMSGKITQFFNPDKKRFINQGDPDWDRELNLRIDQTKGVIDSIKIELNRAKRALSEWKLLPLPEEGQEVHVASTY